MRWVGRSGSSRQAPRWPWTGPNALWVALALTLALPAAGVGTAGAQRASSPLESYLRVEWTVEPAKGGGQRVVGYVYNDRDVWAANVRLLVEALDASGQAVGSTLVSVYGEVPPRNRSYFEAPLPLAGSSYRVTVRVVDWRGYGGGGG
jgi:hypothetical protein